MHTYLNNGTLLSVGVVISALTGGEHPNHDAKYYTILNAAKGKQLTLLQLFTSSSKGKSQIETFIKGEIAKTPGDYSVKSVTVSSSTWFYLYKGYLHIVFPESSIAPYSSGLPDFKMPLSSLKSILIKEVPH